MIYCFQIDNDIPEICTSCEQRVRDFQAFKERVLQNQERYYDKLHGQPESSSTTQSTQSSKIAEEEIDNTDFLNDYISTNLTSDDVLALADDNLLLQNLANLSENTLNTLDVGLFDLDAEQNESLGSISTGTNASSSKENKKEYLNDTKGSAGAGAGGGGGKNGACINNHSYAQTNGHGQVFDCDYCDRNFLTKHELDVHRAFHKTSPGLPCVCRPCDKKFTTIETFETHIKDVHSVLTNGKTCACPVCRKEFTSPRLLLKHKRAHTNYKVTFRCNHCVETFLTKERLEMHLETWHQDNRPFACEMCPLTFSNTRAMKMHVTRVHNPDGVPLNFTCQYCKRKFKRKLQLVEHEAVHTNTFLYNCKYCSKPFRSRSSMYVHVTRLHREQELISKNRKQRLESEKLIRNGFRGNGETPDDSGGGGGGSGKDDDGKVDE